MGSTGMTGVSSGVRKLPRIWKTADVDAESAGRLARDLDIPRALAAALANRGLADRESAQRFLSPRLSELSDPFEFPDMQLAVHRIWEAIDRHQSIVIFGDYDVDGVSSTALMVRVLGCRGAVAILVLSCMGAVATPFLPRRVEDGYGLTAEAAMRCVEAYHPDLVVTVDCGTGSIEAVGWMQEQGIDVIVTDHHEPSGPLAPALALINPKLGTNEETKMLAGVGVAFKLCHALVKQGLVDQREEVKGLDLKSVTDLVALGTISDIVPLRDENRILAQHGLKVLNDQNRPGLRMLLDVASIRGEVEAHHVGFQMGPRLNAAGRLGSAEPALELLLTEDEDHARRLAQQLDAENRKRQDLETRIFKEAVAVIESSYDLSRDFGLVVAGEGWHPGVNGIVASRLVSLFRRPAVVVGFGENGEGRGSCRSVEGFDLVENLAVCADHLKRYGGHAMAAGLQVESAQYEAFRKAFNRAAAERLSGVDLRQVQTIDAWLDLAEADNWLFESTRKLRPFGHNNPQPVWAARGLRIVGRPRIVGRNHLKLCLAGGGRQVDAIGFGLGDRELPDGPMDVAFQLRMDRYQGRESLQMNVQDIRASRPAGEPA